VNLKPKRIEIDPADPFKTDLLQREEEILNLSLLVSNINSPAVFAIDSRWGTGKTTFIKLWENYLKTENRPSLYFNAWETDFSEDPLLSFLGEMNDGLKNLIGSSKESRAAWEATKQAGKQIAKRGIPALIRIGTAGIVDTDKIVEDELAKVAGSLAGDALDNYLKQKQAISEFHTAFADFVESSSNGNPLVIFVDELDRCRPNYAIELLERIKHLFNIEGLVFVLALDKEQLCHSIKAVYGNGIDSEGYLRRFIDFEYRLKKPEITSYIESLIMSFELEAFFNPRRQFRELQYEQEHLQNVFILLALGLKLSLREIEQLFASVNIAIRTAKKNEYIFPALLVFLIIAKQFKADSYERYVTGDADESELVDYLHQIVPEKGRAESFECALVEGFLIAATNDQFKKGRAHSYLRHKAILQEEDLDHKEREYSDTVVNVVDMPAGVGQSVNVQVIKNRIEWLSRFEFFDNEA